MFLRVSPLSRLCPAGREHAAIQVTVPGRAMLAMMSPIANTKVLQVQEDKFRFSCVKLQQVNFTVVSLDS